MYFYKAISKVTLSNICDVPFVMFVYGPGQFAGCCVFFHGYWSVICGYGITWSYTLVSCHKHLSSKSKIPDFKIIAIAFETRKRQLQR